MKKLLLFVFVLMFSHSLFPQVTLLSPNGGEVWLAGSTQNVSWADVNASTGFVNLDYSTDNGVTWNRFANSASSMYPTYSWWIPTLVGTTYKVRVTDANNSFYSDESDAPFTITDQLPPTLTLTYPNGGEIIYSGSQQNITWTSSNIGSVNLHFSSDNGVTWNSIATNLPAYMESYSSIVTSGSTNNAIIRISDASDAATFDESDGVFTILDTTKHKLTLSLPNGGENWQVGSNQYLAWTNTNMTGTVNIDYTTDNGTTWLSVATNLPSMYPTYMWTVPNTPSTSCKIKVYDAADLSIFDESDAVFTISETQPNTLQVISPNGEEFLSSGNIDTIRIYANYEAYVNIDLTTDNGLSWINIETNYALSNPHYIWSVPYSASITCKIRVSDYSTPTIFDESDRVFTISSNPLIQINVLTPNGGENLIVGTNDTIRWQAPSTVNANVYYSTDGGTTWTLIAGNMPSIYPYVIWSIPATVSTACKVKVTDATNESVFDESDMTFTIYDPALITGLVAHYQFNGDVVDYSGNLHNGTANGNVALTNDRFDNPNSAYSFYDNSSIKVPHSPQLNFEGQFTFTVWMNQAGGSSAFNCILGKDYTKEFGFGTWGTGCQAPTYPRLIIGNVETNTNNLSPINCNTWYHLAVTFDDVKDEVRFYINGILTETATNTGSMTATATDMGIGQDGYYTDQFYGVLDDIRIFDYALTSPEIFSIYNESEIQTHILKLEAPNGGEFLVAGSIDTLHWSANYLTQVKLDYTTDYGATWTNIVGSMPAEYPDGSAWVVPNTPSTFCKVRVTDNNNPDSFDESDSVFTIQLFKSGEYVPDANTVLLDHFNATTDAAVLAFKETGLPCGSEWPSAAPNFSFIPGMNELYYALNMAPPISEPQGSTTYLKYPGGQVLSQANGTIEFWIYLPSYEKGLSLVEQGPFFKSCAGWTFNMFIDSTGTLQSSAWAAFGMNSGTHKVPLNKWTHLAVSWGSMGAKMYIDGMWVGSDVNTGMPADGYSGSLLLTLGTGAGVSVLIDELRVSNIQRTEFNIIPQEFVSVVSPNGGENLVAGEVDTIRWTSSNTSILNIEYSTDNGVNWISIYPAMPASVGSVPWLVPNTPSTSCKVRITDADNATIFDESDRVFTINSDIGIDSITYGGKIYHTVKIGAQTWLKENLDIGTMILGTQDQTNNSLIEKYCFNDLPANCDTYGAMYQWSEAMQYSTLPGTQGICPGGWHVASDGEWKELEMQLGMTQTLADATGWRGTNEGSKLKATSGWNSEGNGTDEFGFTALPGGYRYYYNQTFFDLGNKGDWWSATGYDAAESWARRLTNVNGDVYRYHFNKGNGNYVRCIKDENITASIQISSPNGGEVFQANSPVAIEWSASNVRNFSLEFTSDNGASWSLICDTLTSASTGFLWYTPYIESDMVRVRISDKNNPVLFDESDSNFTVTNKITQFIPLYYSGWNMTSFYVQPLSSLPRDVFPSPPVLQVKTELQSFDPSLPDFLNTLKSVDAAQGYLVKVDAAESYFEVTGLPFYPADGLNYRAGWNLMSYYYSYGEAVWYAFDAIMNYVEEIKSASGYFSPLGSEVTNTLYSLEPGEAYWLKLNTKVDGYILPSPQSVMPKKHQTVGQKLMADLPWKLKGYTQSTVAIFTVTSNGEPVNAGSVIAAFVNNECRAISEVKLNSEGTAFATLVINGDKEEEVSFKIFDAVKKEAFGSNLKMKTKPGTTIPGIQELPFTFVTGVEDPILPTTTTLMNAYPNPFNPETRIRYELNKDQHVSLKIYDVLGKEVITLVDDTKNAGYYEVSFDASGLPSGIYFYRMQSGEYVSVKKLLLLK